MKEGTGEILLNKKYTDSTSEPELPNEPSLFISRVKYMLMTAFK